MAVPPSLDPLVAHPDRAGVVTDFDGTLSPIVLDPAAARPLPDAPAVLARLGAKYARVGVVSGRPAAFLLDRLGPLEGVRLIGLYGLEWADGPTVVEHPDVARFRAVMDDAVRAAEEAAPAGVTVEPKGLSVTLHVREVPTLGDWALQWAKLEADRLGLAVHPARKSVELRPPVPIDKGSVVEELLEGLHAGCFVGDDLGDLPAFDALDRLEGRGLLGVRVAVRSAEAPPELLRRADVTLDGPDGALALLSDLAGS
ncbi:MAG: trehalose-phosphatase [Actinobacteria bacterium]|nr:trehalose-phosphatase [Actinomycetota bacterium]MBV9254817.1 trehalose-phosphatase [Actinomycetota bacterium]